MSVFMKSRFNSVIQTVQTCFLNQSTDWLLLGNSQTYCPLEELPIIGNQQKVSLEVHKRLFPQSYFSQVNSCSFLGQISSILMSLSIRLLLNIKISFSIIQIQSIIQKYFLIKINFSHLGYWNNWECTLCVAQHDFQDQHLISFPQSVLYTVFSKMDDLSVMIIYTNSFISFKHQTVINAASTNVDKSIQQLFI